VKTTILYALAAVALLAATAVPCQAEYPAYPIVSSKEREARQAKLAQMAVLVNALSLGKSKLMLKSNVTANPGGRPLRRDGEFGNQFLTVYPVSMPINARLLISTGDGRGLRQYGRILGAAETIAGVADSDGKGRADADVYVLYIPINGPMTPEMPLWLVSLKVNDDGKVTLAAPAKTRVRITHSRMGDDAPSPTVTASIDFTKAAVSMTWKGQTYSLSFAMEILYL